MTSSMSSWLSLPPAPCASVILSLTINEPPLAVFEPCRADTLDRHHAWSDRMCRNAGLAKKRTLMRCQYATQYLAAAAGRILRNRLDIQRHDPLNINTRISIFHAQSGKRHTAHAAPVGISRLIDLIRDLP